jgi:hypothetical protein
MRFMTINVARAHYPESNIGNVQNGIQAKQSEYAVFGFGNRLLSLRRQLPALEQISICILHCYSKIPSFET